MSIFDSLFGAKTDATGPSQTNSIELSPAQQKIFDLAIPYATKFAKDKPQVYNGKTVAGFNANDTAAQNAAVGAVGGINNTAANMQTANNFMLNPDILSPESNPFLKAHGQAVGDEITRQWQQGGARDLRNEDVAAGGAFSGGNSRNMIADSLGATNANRNVGDALTAMYSGAYGQGLNAMGQAVGQAPTVQQAQTYGAGVQASVGQQQREMEQANLDAAVAKFNAKNGINLSKAQDIVNLVNGMPGAKAVSNVTPAQPANDPLKNAIGLGSTLLGAFL